jgi:hypothetical protein
MKKIFFLTLVMIMVLTLSLPSAVLAAKPTLFIAAGTLSDITPGTVRPAGSNGQWLVADRNILGHLNPEDSSGNHYSIQGDFILNYAGIFQLPSQAGNLHGIMKANSDVLAINGEVQRYVFKDEWYVPGVPLLELTVNGHWVGIKGIQGNGNFEAWLKFIPSPGGHVEKIVDSKFSMNGNFQFDQDHLLK